MWVSLISLICSPAIGETWKKELAEGVTLVQKVVGAPRPQIINILRVDPKSPGVRIQAVLAQDQVQTGGSGTGCEVIGSMAKRLNAAAVVNADFFPIGTDIPGDPLNLMVIGGELISEPSERAVFGMTSDGRFLFDSLQFEAKVIYGEGKSFPLRGINRKRAANELIVYTSRFAPSTRTSGVGSEAIVKCDQLPVRIGKTISGTISDIRTGAGDSPLPDGVFVLSGAGTGARFIDENLKSGMTVSIQFTVTGRDTGSWESVVEAVGGGPFLVRNGKMFIDASEAQPGSKVKPSVHPRTMVGATKDGKLILATVDGRQSESAGMTFVQLADIMLAQGCVDAINLDGGGSTTMATPFGILNSPSGGIQRMVANGLAVFANPPSSPSETDFTISNACSVMSGTTTQLCLLDASTGQPLNAEVINRAIWSATGGAGFVDQSGKFHGMKARSGNVVVQLGSKTATVPVETIAGNPSRLAAELSPDPSGAPNRSVLVVSATDVNANSVAGARVSVKITGGAADKTALTTGSDVTASTGVIWDGTSGKVEVTCGSVSASADQGAK